MKANELFNAIMQLDLTSIKIKLTHVQSGEGWSLDKANAVEKEYRRFLCLMKSFPDEDTAPLVDVDTFWHYHILDTVKYATDCEQVFGYFLHHYPYVGMDGTFEDEQFRLESGARMRVLYETMFGETYPDAQAAAAQTISTTNDRHASGQTRMTAWCAGPAGQGPIRACENTTAWCAGPAVKITAHASGNATAWCADPAARKFPGQPGLPPERH